jgi:CheY-like chemotaxis protein
LAQDGEAGVQAVREGRLELVLLDMSMPVKDGWTAARGLRANPAAASNQCAQGAGLARLGASAMHPPPASPPPSLADAKQK